MKKRLKSHLDVVASMAATKTSTAPPSQKKQTKTSWSQKLKNEGKKFTPVPRARQAQTRDRYYWNLKFTNHTTMSITKKTMLKTKLIILVMFLPMFPLLLSGPARLVFPPPHWKRSDADRFVATLYHIVNSDHVRSFMVEEVLHFAIKKPSLPFIVRFDFSNIGTNWFKNFRGFSQMWEFLGQTQMDIRYQME